VWATAGEVLFGSKTLSLHNAHAAELVPTEVLSNVSLLGMLFKQDVYGGFLSDLRETVPDGAAVIEFPYDWRRDLRIASQQLGALVDSLHAQGVKRIDVIAHSMGGLVLYRYLRFGTGDRETWEGLTKLARVATVGTPFFGTPKMLRDFQRGNPIGPNTTLLSAEALSTFDACFALLPAPEESFLIDPAGGEIPVDLYDPQQWLSRQWGSLRDGEQPGELEELTAHLRAARDFRTSLFSPPAADPPQAHTRFLAIRGRGHSTESKCYFLPQSKFKLACGEKEISDAGEKLSAAPLYEDGDGVVNLRSSAVPPVFENELDVRSIIVEGEHLGMLGEDAVREALFPFFFSESD